MRGWAADLRGGQPLFCFGVEFANRLRHFIVSIDKITGIRLANGANAVLSKVKSKRLHAAKHE